MLACSGVHGSDLPQRLAYPNIERSFCIYNTLNVGRIDVQSESVMCPDSFLSPQHGGVDVTVPSSQLPIAVAGSCVDAGQRSSDNSQQLSGDVSSVQSPEPSQVLDIYTHAFVVPCQSTSLTHSLLRDIAGQTRGPAVQACNDAYSDDVSSECAPSVHESERMPYDERHHAKHTTSPRMRLATFNGNAWSTIQQYVRICDSNVICIQEHKLIGPCVDEANIWLKKQGWTAYWEPAKETMAGGITSGVAVLVRSFIQSWPVAGPAVYPARTAACVVCAGGLGPIIIMSAYCITNKQAKLSMTFDNYMMFLSIGEFIRNAVHPVLLGGDWQCEPACIDRTGFLEPLKLKIIHASVGEGGSNVSGTPELWSDPT